jgi:2-dehydropantoate 2-reductase
MRSIILGAGAIGGVVGGLLARARRDVLLLARGAHLERMRQHGLRIETPTESFVVRTEVGDPREPIAWRPGDVVLLAVKTQDAATALRQLAAPPDVPVVCLTNGLEAERIALRFARDVYGACVLIPATHLEPGVVQAWASPNPGVIDLGRYPDGTGTHADELAGELAVAGFDCEVRSTIMKWKRGKLLSNLANGAEALCGPPARRSDVAERARREGRAVFAAANLSCITEAEDAARRAGYTSRPIAGATRDGGSTWQSLARGASSLETDYLNGEIVLLGRLHGVATPVNEALQRLAAEAVRTGARPGAMSLDELAARVDADAQGVGSPG